MRRLFGLVFVMGLGVITSCSSQDTRTTVGFEAKPLGADFKAELFEKSLGDSEVRAKLESSEPQGFSISRGMLSKQLVWSHWIEKGDGSIYPGYGTGMSTGSIMVHFEISGDEKWVHLFRTNLNPIDVDIPDDLIDRFPVLATNADRVDFNFAAGLGKQFLENWTGKTTLIKIDYSFVYKFLNEGNVITFAQLLKLDDEKLSTVVLRHAFRMVEENSSFAIVKAENPLAIGIFPSQPDWTGKVTAGLMPLRKMDISNGRKIKFFISSNVPQEYKAVIKEGILWWNRAFKSDVVDVELLSQPVDWADARINILQWSANPAFCGGSGGAFGPSEANPVTGEIYSGKVLFCGVGMSKTFCETTIDGRTIPNDDCVKKMLRWMAAHEVGHTFGLAHNFYGKSYRDPSDRSVITSTVMDYLHPIDTSRVESIGPRDMALIDFLYLTNGSAASLEKVRSFPLCRDADTAADPECNHFTPGGVPAKDLVGWLASKIETDRDHVMTADGQVVVAIVKYLLTRADDTAFAAFQKLMDQRIQGAQPPRTSAWMIDGLTAIAEIKVTETKDVFVKLDPQYRAKVMKFFTSDFMFDGRYDLCVELQIRMLKMLASYKDTIAFESLKEIQSRISAQLANTTDPNMLTKLHTLKAVVDKICAEFWN